MLDMDGEIGLLGHSLTVRACQLLHFLVCEINKIKILAIKVY
jgi:hypothetical protein